MRLRRGRVLAAALVAVAATSLAGHGLVGVGHAASEPPGSEAAAGHDHAPDGVGQDHPDAAVTGPQGAEGQFVVECELSHTAGDDPIVHAGHAGMSHLHDFFGNEATAAGSTYADLIDAGTSCQKRSDTAAYWVPALVDGDGESIAPVRSVAYYRAGAGIDPATVRPYPPDLMMIAGDSEATGEQPTSVVAWTCNAGGSRLPAPPDCGPTAGLRLIVTFPDCWDGERTDSDDHRSHMSYSHAGACDADHPVPVPQLQFAVDYPIVGDESALTLASGPVYTAHADFWNVWDQTALEREVELCVVDQHVCGVSHRRAAQP